MPRPIPQPRRRSDPSARIPCRESGSAPLRSARSCRRRTPPLARIRAWRMGPPPEPAHSRSGTRSPLGQDVRPVELLAALAAEAVLLALDVRHPELLRHHLAAGVARGDDGVPDLGLDRLPVAHPATPPSS